MKGSKLWSNVFDIPKKQQEIKEKEKLFLLSEFWQGQGALQIQKEFNRVKSEVDLFASLKQELDYLNDYWEISQNDEDLGKEFNQKLKNLDEKLQQSFLLVFLTGKYDKGSAILSVQSGAGGRDAEDWASMILRMYQRYSWKNGWNTKILSQNLTEGGGPDGRIGIKEAVLEIKGEWAYGFLRGETGVHRLVRLSPFSANALRHTSFVKVEILPLIDDIGLSDILIKPEEMQIDFSKSSGPGGQNVNKRQTAVKITHLPTGLQASCQTERTQAENRKIALRILMAKVVCRNEKIKKEEIQSFRAKDVNPEFGHQIRSYVLHPYKLVKDLRTGYETSEAENVLEGDLWGFIQIEIEKLTNIG